MITERFEDIYDRVIELRRLVSEEVHSDSYILLTFNNVQDELVSLEVYVKEMQIDGEVDSVPRILQETSFRDSE